jgi:hypothetical protein
LGTRISLYRISAVVLTLTLALPAVAADKFDAEARAVAPFLDAQTVAVAHVDLTRIDAEKLSNWAVEVGGLEAKTIEEPRRALQSWLADLTRAGGRELYVVISLAELPLESPLVIVPLAADADAQAVRRVLERVDAFKQLHFEKHNQALLGGSEGARKRLQGSKPTARPELAKAFAAAGDSAAQLLLQPTPDTRRVLDELLPALPPQVGGGSTRPLTHGLRWAAVGVDLPPKLSLRLVIQSPDADAAGKLKELLTRMVKAALQQREARAFLPDIGRLTEKLALRVEGDRLTLSLGEEELKAFLLAPVRSWHQAVERRQQENNLHRLTIAMHNYADTYKGRFPATANFDKQGKPLLSWRVHLLPFVGANDLYKQFHLDEPWDSPHNKQLLARMPEVYQGPNRTLNREGKTIYLLPVGKDAAFKDGPEGPRLPQDFPDGMSNTILIVEADDAHAVPWTKPEDLKIDLEHPERGLGGHFRGGFVVGMGDGSVRLIAQGISKTTLRAAFTPAGGEVLGSDW